MPPRPGFVFLVCFWVENETPAASCGEGVYVSTRMGGWDAACGAGMEVLEYTRLPCLLVFYIYIYTTTDAVTLNYNAKNNWNKNLTY